MSATPSSPDMDYKPVIYMVEEPPTLMAYVDQYAQSFVPTTRQRTLTTRDLLFALRQALTHAHQDRNIRLIIELSESIAHVYFSRQQFEDARSYTEQAMRIVRDTNDNRRLGYLMLSLGIIEYKLGNPEVANTNLWQGETLAEGINDPVLSGYLTCWLGCVHCYMGQYQTADDYFAQSRTHFDSVYNTTGVAWWQCCLAREYLRDHGWYEQAIEALQEALTTFSEKGSVMAKVEILLAMTDCHLRLGHVTLAQEYLNQVDKLINANKRSWYYPEMVFLQARTAQRQQNSDEALNKIYQAIGAITINSDITLLSPLYYNLALMLERKRQYEDARDAHERGLSISGRQARRLHYAFALRYAGNHYWRYCDTLTQRARGNGYLFASQRLFFSMDLKDPNLIEGTGALISS